MKYVVNIVKQIKICQMIVYRRYGNRQAAQQMLLITIWIHGKAKQKLQ
jgi:hypothetical protein